MEKITASIVIYKNDFTTLTRAVQSFLNSPFAGKLFIIDNSPTDTARKFFTNPRINYLFTGATLDTERRTTSPSKPV